MNLDVNNKLADAGLPAGARLAVLAALAIADARDVVSVSQAEIAKAARVSLATASAGLRRARALGLVREVEGASPARRQPARLSLRPVLGRRSRS
jgi:hypothetical protein